MSRTAAVRTVWPWKTMFLGRTSTGKTLPSLRIPRVPYWLSKPAAMWWRIWSWHWAGTTTMMSRPISSSRR